MNGRSGTADNERGLGWAGNGPFMFNKTHIAVQSGMRHFYQRFGAGQYGLHGAERHTFATGFKQVFCSSIDKLNTQLMVQHEYGGGQ